METKQPEIYCSLDIETSGFDPKTCEVLEVGMTFFTLGQSGAQTTEEWTCVCKPAGPVEPKILSLTGISQAELDNALPFLDYKDVIQEKLKHVTIVGHNVIFDITFLKTKGIEILGKSIDTLELVQFILPTHHSYNLENLMHAFSIPFVDAHRALADSKACIAVLEGLLGVFKNFPQKLQKEINVLAARKDFTWLPLLAIEVPLKSLQEFQAEDFLEEDVVYPFSENKKIIILPAGGSAVDRILPSLTKLKEQSLLVVPRNSTVLRLWRSGVARGITIEENSFNEDKFKVFIENEALESEQIMFALKVLVWKYTNWQTESIADLNLSFFGGQFRSLVTGGKAMAPRKEHILCTDMESFEKLAAAGHFIGRNVVIVGLSEFEQQVNSNLATRVSWSFVSYILKSYYNPELQKGISAYKELVQNGLNATDLFFGLTGALLRTNDSFSYFKITSDIEYSEVFGKVRSAAGHYCENLSEINKTLKSTELSQIIESLLAFFRSNFSYVKWIELADTRCIFHSTPLDIQGIVTKQLTLYKKVYFVDTGSNEQMLLFYINRLGLADYSIEKKASITQDLQPADTSRLQKQEVFVHVRENLDVPREMLELLSEESLPAVVLFANISQVKEFAERHYSYLKQFSSLFVQQGSGGSRLFRNFSIYKNSLLLGTDKFVLKSLSGGSTGINEHLAVKTLIICHLPFEQYSHPYQEALSATFSKPFEQFSLPKAVWNLHRLLEFFYTPLLKNIYICDDKISKEYGEEFKAYLKSVPYLLEKE